MFGNVLIAHVNRRSAIGQSQHRLRTGPNGINERLALIQRVGVAEYQRLLNGYGDEHRERTTVAVINERSIWSVECKYGRVFAVQGSKVAFATLDGAKAYARTLSEGPKNRPSWSLWSH